MDHAWLDSLSEDWLSQPRSAGSPAPSLPSFSDSTSSAPAKHRTSLSRIPKFDPKKQEWSTPNEADNNPLGERNLSEANIPLSQRAPQGPSKLREELCHSTRGRHPRRSSVSTVPSSPYNTVQRQSLSLSPKKGMQETPEWKRRLIHGDVAYGDQKDLFAPAGLENIFRPPSPQNTLPTKILSQTFQDNSVMPSSPPVYRNGQESERQNGAIRKEQKGMKYTMVHERSSALSTNDLSYDSSFGSVLRPSQGCPRGDCQIDANRHQPAPSQDKRSHGFRVVSGQSDAKNEGLSPIYVSRHNTLDGKIDYAAMDISASELNKVSENPNNELKNDLAEGCSVNTDTSHMLPLNVTTDTEDFAHNGKFVNLRRGGHFEEGSFQKRMLSSTSLPVIRESSMLPEESMQASTPKQLPNVKKTRESTEAAEHVAIPTTPPVHRTPRPNPSKSAGTEAKTSSGSPLKLFGTYDTFTNQTLLRRLRSFEEHFDGDEEQGTTAEGHPHNDNGLKKSSIKQTKSNEVLGLHEANDTSSRRVSSFGRGELDDFPFSEKVKYDSNRYNSQYEDKDNFELPMLNPQRQTSFKFQLESSPSLLQCTQTKRHTKTNNTKKRTTERIVSIRRLRPRSENSGSDYDSDSEDYCSSSDEAEATAPRRRSGDSEGKRLANSPLKYPESKRRRTLHEAEIGTLTTSKGETASLTVSTQASSGDSKRSKDDRYEDGLQAADPKILSMRQILRPRTPTPSQRSSVQREQEPIQELEQARLLQEQKIAMIQAELDAGETHKQLVPLGVGQHVLSDGRKGSITTQDFLDEAKMIMLAIRGNARPNSGLASVEESESENDRRLSPGGRVVRIPSEDSEDTYQESTIEPFSRPPSREGAPLPRQNTKAQDPAVLDHLRKYAEINDMDGIVASSVRSIAMAREAAKNAKEIDRAASETISRAKSGRLIESDPPNIRIVESVEIQRKRKYSASTVETGHETPEFLSQSSTASTQSTASIPTGSSRGSDSRRVIPPHTVSHLIPQQVAGMVFDPENNIWRKTKTVVGADEAQATHSSDDEDPFGDIPDLSIDETKELHRLKAVAAERQKGELLAQNSSRSRCEGVHHDPEREEPTSSRNLSSRSRSSSAGSTTGPQETFSTSRSEQSDAQKRNLHHMAGAESETETRDFIHQTVKSTIRHHHGEVLEEFEKEISINEGRVKPTNQNRRRNVTITFSSPIASIRHMSPPMSPYRNDGESVQLEEIDQYEFDNLDECSEEDSVAVAKGRPPSHTSTPSKPHVASGKASRQISLSGHKFQKRPVSRIDEQEEEYTDNVEASRKTISVVIETPSQARKASVMVVATPRRPSHEVGTLTLTPMSDFTINQKESPFGLDVSYVAGGQRYVSGNNGGRTLSLSIKQLVEKITEIEPYEPYWESMKQIELKDKKLTSLHKLDEFCAELVKLDVSRNQISQLNGAPQTIRHLTITHNYLSDLTAWGHLANLQYVDVSNNELESLSVFSSLHHLRGLKADNNKINSLDGIGRLDSLLSLHVRGNMIESLDFAGCRLERLQELDLNANRIRTIRNIHLLKSLSTLNVETNELSSFSVDGSHKLDSLKYLRLNGNFLKSIDVSRLSNLRLLYLDQNRLGNITGLLKAKHLDSLSLREQRGGSAFNTSFLSQAVEIRKLFLSANVLDRFEPCAKFLNMQYLEIANCGLERLPKDFGFMFPNVRALNLSMNALRNIDGLVGISRLKTLYLAGNRVGVVGGTVDVLRKMESLRFVDLRNNQLNVGFYPPRLESQSMELTKVTTEAPVLDPFTLPKADEHWDKVYLSRLDMSTKMLRRIYEIMVIGGVKGLKTLDGLDVDRAALKVHDDVWEALVKVGIMKTEVTPSPPVAKDCYVQVRVQSPTREPTNSRHRVSAPTPEPRRPWRTES